MRTKIRDPPEALSQVLGRRDPTGLDRGGFFILFPVDSLVTEWGIEKSIGRPTVKKTGNKPID